MILLGRYCIHWLSRMDVSDAPFLSARTTLRGERRWRVWRLAVTRYP